MSGDRRLTLVSNRLPYELVAEPGASRYRRAPGGLVTALQAVIADHDVTWVGWPGVEHTGEAAHELPADDGVRCVAVHLTGREVTQYYNGFSNRTLWPVCHWFPTRTRFDGAHWRAYERVNARFAETAAAASQPDDLIWVHDYQLMLVPAMLRALEPDRRIAFFLHIPFPSADVFRIVPWARSLLMGMLGADLVGFHLREYAENFLDCATRLLGCEVDRAAGRLLFDGRTIAVEAYPISIDSAAQERLARTAADQPGGIKRILGVDRLDYTKGICERLAAVERLLERRPDLRGGVEFTQILVPSRERVDEYQALKREIDETVGRINGRFADGAWSPIRYLVRRVPPAELAGLYRNADIALVTPLRDGMNLVAKEYVASQVDDDGVLVLSELAGAAAELPEAIIVNPYDIEAVAEALERAIAMPGDERQTRMAMLRDRLRHNDVAQWSRRFLAGADAAVERRDQGAKPVEAARRRLGPWLTERPRLALFLDYDGTLTPIVPRPEQAILSEETRRVIGLAVSAPDIDTNIVSGRELGDVHARVGVEGVTYLGDHGYRIEGPGISYEHRAAEPHRGRLAAAARDLEALAVPGAAVERKFASVAYHVRGVAGPMQARAAHDAEIVFRRYKLAVLVGKAVVEALPPSPWDKGQAVLHLLRARHGADWPSRVRALYIGDDTTDEFAFRALRGIGRSIRVVEPGSTQPTAADLTVSSPDDVLQLLRWLASGALRVAARIGV